MAEDYSDLIGKYGESENTNQKSIDNVDYSDLINRYGQSAAEAAAERTKKSVLGHQGNSTEELIKGFGKGALDVGNTIGQGVEFLDQLINSNAKVNFDTGKVEVSG